MRLVEFEENKTGSCVCSSTWTSLKRGQIPNKTGKGKANLRAKDKPKKEPGPHEP